MGLKIKDKYFKELIAAIRECDDPDDVICEVYDARGNSITFKNNALWLTSEEANINVTLDQLSESQRIMIHEVLIDRVVRAVNNIVSGVFDVG